MRFDWMTIVAALVILIAVGYLLMKRRGRT